MQRMGVVLVLFVLAVGISLGVSFFLWGQPVAGNGASDKSSEVEALRTRVDVLERQLETVTTRQAELDVAGGDFEVLLARIDMLDRKLKESAALEGMAGADPTNPDVRETLARTAEEKAREVYKDMKAEEQRKRDEERQKQREEHRREREEYLVKVYDERLARLTKELSLTPNQEAAVREAFNTRKDGIMKLYGNWGRGGGDSGRNTPSWDDVNNTFNTTMKQVLDAQQFKVYKDKKLDDFSGRRDRGRGPGAGSRSHFSFEASFCHLASASGCSSGSRSGSNPWSVCSKL